jgi:GNAT superfamily N-acetyltransferase
VSTVNPQPPGKRKPTTAKRAAAKATTAATTNPSAVEIRALRSPVLKARDVAEDPRVWLVPCFFVRRDARRQGVTHALLDAAVELARQHGATAVEGFPLAGDARRTAADAYLGVEPLFAASGFHVVARPTPARVLMRRQLSR